jgi:putative tryptophan/tyrosine transport system substrate-binding protein
MRRRDLVALLGSTAIAWPLVARAQQPSQMRRIGVLSLLAETDAEAQVDDAAFRKRLTDLGWTDGRNIRVDCRWGAGNVGRVQMFAKELVGLNPDVLVSLFTPSTAALQSETKTVPIVFAMVSDPLGSGFVASFARPGGNITGFVNLEASLSGKWLELMHRIAPSVSRVAMLFNPQSEPYARYYLDTFHAGAAALSVMAIEAPFHDAVEIESAMTNLGSNSDSGLVVMPGTSTWVHRELICALAARFRLPAIYPFRYFTTSGGLLSYGIDSSDLLRGAASYVDRILRGAKVNELPVQLPTKFELVINRKTADTLGITIPDGLLAAADEVID